MPGGGIGGVQITRRKHRFAAGGLCAGNVHGIVPLSPVQAKSLQQAGGLGLGLAQIQRPAGEQQPPQLIHHGVHGKVQHKALVFVQPLFPAAEQQRPQPGPQQLFAQGVQ